MERVTLQPHEIRSLLPTHVGAPDMRFIFQLIYLAGGEKDALREPIWLKRHNGNYILLDGRHRCLAAILTDRSLAGLVFSTKEEAQGAGREKYGAGTIPIISGFDDALWFVRDCAAWGARSVEEILLHPETMQNAKGERFYEPQQIDWLEHGLRAYDRFVAQEERRVADGFVTVLRL